MYGSRFTYKTTTVVATKPAMNIAADPRIRTVDHGSMRPLTPPPRRPIVSTTTSSASLKVPPSRKCKGCRGLSRHGRSGRGFRTCLLGRAGPSCSPFTSRHAWRPSATKGARCKYGCPALPINRFCRNDARPVRRHRKGDVRGSSTGLCRPARSGQSPESRVGVPRLTARWLPPYLR